MKRGAKARKLNLKFIGSTAPSVKGIDETKKVCKYKPNGGYLEQDGACCKKCHCSNFEDTKVRGYCGLLECQVSENGLCNRFVKPRAKQANSMPTL